MDQKSEFRNESSTEDDAKQLYLSKYQISKFRNAKGARLLNGLFYETTGKDKSKVLYTLKEKDYAGYLSLKRLYLEAEDTTEWSFATQHLESYEHWMMLCNCNWFKPIAEQWREELRLKLEHRYLEELKDIAATEGSKERPNAVKILLTRLQKKQPKRPVGRPEKIEPVHTVDHIINERYERLLNNESSSENPNPETSELEDGSSGEIYSGESGTEAVQDEQKPELEERGGQLAPEQGPEQESTDHPEALKQPSGDVLGAGQRRADAVQLSFERIAG